MGLKRKVMEEIAQQQAFLSLIEQLELPRIQGELDFYHMIEDALHQTEVKRWKEAKEKLKKNRPFMKSYGHREGMINKLRAIVDECRAGNMTSADILNTAVESAKINPDELSCSREEVTRFFQSGFIQTIHKLHSDCSNGDYNGLRELISLLEMAGQGMLPSLEEIGIDREEIERLKRIQSLLP
jgi:hypothetical protein